MLHSRACASSVLGKPNLTRYAPSWDQGDHLSWSGIVSMVASIPWLCDAPSSRDHLPNHHGWSALAWCAASKQNTIESPWYHGVTYKVAKLKWTVAEMLNQTGQTLFDPLRNILQQIDCGTGFLFPKAVCSCKRRGWVMHLPSRQVKKHEKSFEPLPPPPTFWWSNPGSSLNAPRTPTDGADWMRLVVGATGTQALHLSTGIRLSIETNRCTLNATSSPRFVLTTMLLSGFTDVAKTVEKVLSGPSEDFLMVQNYCKEFWRLVHPRICLTSSGTTWRFVILCWDLISLP